MVLHVCAGSPSGHSWKWSSWTTFWGRKVCGELLRCNQWCSTPHGRLCTCTGTLFASLREQAFSQGAFSFVIAGQSWRLVIIRTVCTDSFQHKCQNFTLLLEPSFCFPPGIPCRSCGWRDSFGNLALPSRQQEPANTSGGTGGVLPQQRLRVRAHLQIFSCNAVLLELLLEISSIQKRQQNQIWTNFISHYLFVSLLCLVPHMWARRVECVLQWDTHAGLTQLLNVAFNNNKIRKEHNEYKSFLKCCHKVCDLTIDKPYIYVIYYIFTYISIKLGKIGYSHSTKFELSLFHVFAFIWFQKNWTFLSLYFSEIIKYKSIIQQSWIKILC